MHVDHDGRYVFVHVPRTGGHTGYSLLGVKPTHPLHASRKEIRHYDYFSFGFIRNPWDRMYSCYRRQRKFSEYVGVSFKDYLMNRIQDDGVGRSAMCLLDGCTFIGRYERFNDDWAVIADRIKIKIAGIPRLNAYGEADYQNHYDDEMIAFVEQQYSDDIEYGQYTFDNL